MPPLEIPAVHERLRRTALGLDRTNPLRYQLRAVSELIRLAGPSWRARSRSPQRSAWFGRTLAEIFTAGSRDPIHGVFVPRQVADFAWDALTSLTEPAAREAVRQVWLDDPTGELKNLVTRDNWLPQEPRQKAVTLFLLGDFDRYTVVDPSGELLESARTEGDPALRVQLAAAARRWDRLGWAYRVAAVPERLLPEEWEALIELLGKADREKYLWRLIDRAPLEWSARCLTELGDWRPSDEAGHLVQLAKNYAAAPPGRAPFTVTPEDQTTPQDSSMQPVRVRRRRGPKWPTIGQVPVAVVGMHSVTTIASSLPSGTVIAGGRTADLRSQVVVARLPTGNPIAVLESPDLRANPVITPDGRYLALLESNGLALWRLPACSPVETRRELADHDGSEAHTAITPDSRLLVAAGPHRAEVFEIPSGRRLAPIELGRVQLAGALLVGIDSDGATAVLRYRPSRLAELAERPIGELTGAETEVFSAQYDDPADASLAKLGAALLTYLRRRSG